jgi:hypothetical protein
MHMKQNKQTKNWWIDALMFIGYLLCFYLDLTGVIGHQWLGVGIGVLVFLHTWLHWDWVSAVTRRFRNGTSAKNRWYYLINALILFGFIVILETGVVISTWLNLNLPNYPAWLDIHLYASYITLGLLVLKVGLHWRWVVNTAARIFRSNKRLAPAGHLEPVPVPVDTNKRPIDRRRFLGLMGVVGAGSVLAVANVVRANALLSDTSDGNASAMGLTDQAAVQASVTTTSTTTVEETSVAIETATASPVIEPTAIATVEPTAAPTQAVVTACQVRCPKGCSYPGRCRRYVDQNGNRLCDLGECL